MAREPLMLVRLLPAGCIGYASRRPGCQIETTASAAAQLVRAGHAELVRPDDDLRLLRAHMASAPKPWKPPP